MAITPVPKVLQKVPFANLIVIKDFSYHHMDTKNLTALTLLVLIISDLVNLFLTFAFLSVVCDKSLQKTDFCFEST